MKHIKTPWVKDKYGQLVTTDGDFVTVWGLGIGHSNKSEESEANAVFIVKAVNNHDKLLHALDRIRRTGFNGTEEEAPHKIAAEAIKQAEAE